MAENTSITHSKEHHIKVGQTHFGAATLLSEATGLSVREIKSIMQKGAVWVTDSRGVRRLRRAKKTVQPGSELHLYYDPSVLRQTVSPPDLIADEGDYSVWYKPTRMLSQGSKWGDHCTLSRWVETHDKKHRPALTIHRLDRAASGLMLIAHSKKTAGLLAAMFINKTIDKQYRAIVHGQFPIEDAVTVFDEPIDNRTARTHANALQVDTAQNQSILQLRIDTGRKHQIRKHLSAAGFPIVGDRLYGGGDQCDLQLMAVSLRFCCPLTGKDRYYRCDSASGSI